MRALNDPRLQARVSDLEFAHAVLVLAADPIEDAPILDLRLRKGIRRHGMRLIQASPAELLADRGSHRSSIGRGDGHTAAGVAGAPGSRPASRVSPASPARISPSSCATPARTSWSSGMSA